MSIRKGIGYSPLTDRVYIGKQNKEKRMWVGEKEDVTNDFLNICFQYFEEGTVRTIGSEHKENVFVNVRKGDKKGIEGVIKLLKKELATI